MAAIHASLVSLVQAGDRIVATNAVYGSTRSQLVNVLGPLGIRTDFVDATDHDAVAAALAAGPVRVLYTETLSNPTMVVADHAALADLAHRHGAAYVVDNTFASPYVCRPLEHGADLVIESATKYIGGHSDVLAGTVAGRGDLVAAVGRVQVDTGATLAPLAAFLVMRGLATLGVRLDRHAATSTALARWLERQDGVRHVRHPLLPSHPAADVVARQFHGGSGMFAFELEGGRPAARAFVDALTIPALTASLGSIHTMIVHPPSTTHRQLNDAELAAAGIGPGLLRCSIGLEDVDDLLADFTHGPRSRPRGDARAGDRLGASDRDDRGRSGRAPFDRPEPARPRRACAVATADVRRLRGRPDHLPRARCGGRHDDPPAARLRVPLRDRLRGPDGRDPRAVRPAVRDRRRRGPRAPRGLPGVPLAVVQRRAGRPRALDRVLHDQPDPPPVARRVGRARGSAGPVLRPEAAGPRTDARRVAGRRPARLSQAWLPASRGRGRRRDALRLRRPEQVLEARDAVHAPRADHLPARGRGQLPAGRRAGPGGRGGPVAHGPAHRHARPAARQEPGLRCSGHGHRQSHRLHDGRSRSTATGRRSRARQSA